MPRVAEMREESRLYRRAAKQEATWHLSRRLASHALALAQLAERIEREEAERVKPEAAGQPNSH